MMSRADAVNSNTSHRGSIGLVALLLLSVLGGIISAPVASANFAGDLEITESISPKNGSVISSWDPISLEVKVTNTGFVYNTDTRIIEWYICEGIKDELSCISTNEDSGTGIVEAIPVDQFTTFTFDQTFSPDGDEGNYTAVFRFQDDDYITSNDVLITNFRLTTSLVDVSVAPQNPVSQLTGLAVYDGEKILNTNTDYNMSLSGIVTSCGACGLVAEIGWKLFNESGIEVANSSLQYSNLPSWGEASFQRDLPPLNHDEEGEFTFLFGLVNSSGTPEGDMNDYNDVQSVQVIFDDTVDIKVASLSPLHAPTSTTYFYGNDSVAASISNQGNVTVYEPLVRFTVSDLFGEIQSEEDCRPDEILPGHSFTCIFDLGYLGDKELKVYANEILTEGSDAKPADNTITTISEVVASSINPVIEQSNFYGQYQTSDVIEFNTRISPTAAAPLEYSWWMSGIFPLGTGKQFNLTAETIGLGEHYISVRVTDSLQTMETASTIITVYNSTDISQGTWMNGTAITTTHAAANVEYDYPIPGVTYSAGEGVDALLIMSVDVDTTELDETDPGLDYMEFDLNISQLIPDNIPRESIAIHQLYGMDQVDWGTLDGENYFELIDEHTIRVHLIENMDLLIMGELPPPEIESGEPEITLLPDGEMRIDWEPSGDLQNPYFGGWKIFKVTGNDGGSTYFPDPEETTSAFIWNGLMSGNLVANLSGTTSSWTDESGLPTGTCVSYALMPMDRAGVPSPLQGKVTRVDGSPGLECGDAIDPTSEVSSFKHSVEYNNDTACLELNKDWNSCYELTLSWIWPDHEPEGNISWNLYRIEQRPDEIDIKVLDPIATDLVNVPGETGYYWQNGTDSDGIRPTRTYYYILAPVDWVGNEQTFVDYPSSNVERVHIKDEYWNYNQHRIPEPPAPEEPPYGIEWLGDLEDYMEIGTFKIAGLVLIGILMMNFIGLPIILKKRKRMKRVLAKRAANAPIDEDEFDDFFS